VVELDGHTKNDGQLRAQLDSCSEHSRLFRGNTDPRSKCNLVDPGNCIGRPSSPTEPTGGYNEIEDRSVDPISEYVVEDIDPKVVKEDPTEIYALQFFNPSEHNDNTLETGIDLTAHLRTASLNINGITQQKLPIILT